MRILFFSRYPSLFKSSHGSTYHGEGWVSSLQETIEQTADDIDLGISFFFPKNENITQKGKITCYPIFKKKKSNIQKLLYYWGGFKRKNTTHLPEVLNIIKDFKPDLIHVFGIESPFAFIAGNTEIPVIVHLQGILNPVLNAFFPQGMNRTTFLLKHFSINEWLLRNGYNFAFDETKVRSQREVSYFKNIKYFMGRTEWDFQISRIFSPHSEYFHIDEMLRPPFYESSSWKIPTSDKFVIISTISETVYKGLDIILKTAQFLKQHNILNFEWRVIGVTGNSKYVRFFEKNYQIKGENVNITYLGILNAEQICANFQQAHTYAHPSYIDNSPNSLCEAQLIGLPVIGTYVGGIPSLITHDETGLLVPVNAPYELAYQLQYLCQHPEVMMRLSKKAREIAICRHSKEKIMKNLLFAYQQIQNEYKLKNKHFE